MNIAVLAANGRTGRAFVSEALKAGHTVVAGVHRTGRFNAHENLQIVPYDALQSAEVAQLIKDADAVVSCIGHVRGAPATVQADAMRILTEQMKYFGIRRLVSVTGTGVRQTEDAIPLLDRVLNIIVEKIDPDRIHDGWHHADIIKDSSLDWTIVRVLRLQEFPKRFRAMRLTSHGPTAYWVNRTQVAKRMLQVIEKRQFVGKMPIVSVER